LGASFTLNVIKEFAQLFKLKVKDGPLVGCVRNQVTEAKLTSLRFNICLSNFISLFRCESLSLVWRMAGLGAATFGLIFG
jgi:hypothetical protein